MRIRELLTERGMSQRTKRAMSFTKHFPTMPSSDAYKAYRFAMAMADHTINHAEGPTAQHAVIVAYTPEEEDIIRGGETQTGHKGVVLSPRGSAEPISTNSRSPVAAVRVNKYGV